jgi:predicted GTPase
MIPTYKEHKDRTLRIQSAIKAINALLPLDLYPAHKKELISVCLWKVTEADGKSKVRYWSEGAINNQQEKLNHEHVHERKELISRLLNGENVESVMNDAIACMVTKEEHQLLGQSLKSGWERYKESSIRVFDTKEQRWRW